MYALLHTLLSPPVENKCFAQSRIGPDRNELASGGAGGYGDCIGYRVYGDWLHSSCILN